MSVELVFWNANGQPALRLPVRGVSGGWERDMIPIYEEKGRGARTGEIAGPARWNLEFDLALPPNPEGPAAPSDGLLVDLTDMLVRVTLEGSAT